MEIPSECGYVARGADDDELVAAAQTHARDVHRMELTAKVVLAVARSTTDARPPGERRSHLTR